MIIPFHYITLVLLLCFVTEATGRIRWTDGVASQSYSAAQNNTRTTVSSEANIFELVDSRIRDVCTALKITREVAFSQCTTLVSFSWRLEMLEYLRKCFYFSQHEYKEGTDYYYLMRSNQSDVKWHDDYVRANVNNAAVDSTLIYLQYAYATRTLDNLKYQNVCIIGRFNWVLSKMILALNPLYQVWYFSHGFDDEANEHDLLHLLRFRKHLIPGQFVHIIHDVPFVRFFQLQLAGKREPFCDILHIRLEYRFTPREVVALSDLALRAIPGQHVTQLIWEKSLGELQSPADVRSEYDAKDSRISWIGVAYGQRHITLELRHDSYGFYSGPGCMFNELAPQVVTLFGHLKPNEPAVLSNSTKESTIELCNSSISGIVGPLIVYISYVHLYHQGNNVFIRYITL